MTAPLTVRRIWLICDPGCECHKHEAIERAADRACAMAADEEWERRETKRAIRAVKARMG